MIKARDSNFELLRIFLMLVIVAHHYIINSGIVNVINEISEIKNYGGGYSCIALLYGWGGKTAINCFVLITGWFMCKQEFKWKKLLRLYLEVKFYTITIYFIFLITGYIQFSYKECFLTIFNVGVGIGKGFTSSFIVFYALIPFLNKFIKNIDKKEHGILILVLLTAISIIPTMCFNNSFEYITWYSILYLIAAYIRLYPNKMSESKKITAIGTLICLMLSWLSIIVIYKVGVKCNHVLDTHHFVADSNKILAVVTSIAIFCFFKNISLGQNKFINTVSSATFGVLLIHASSDMMRKWLWQDVCKNVWHFQNNSLSEFLLHAVCCTICVFALCTIIDLIRQLIQRKIMGLNVCLNKKQSQ